MIHNSHPENSRMGFLELANPKESWSPVKKRQAIEEILSNCYQHYVNWIDFTTEIKVEVNNFSNKYLRTDKDSTARNNLEELQDCY
jgi:hypothetical protein